MIQLGIRCRTGLFFLNVLHFLGRIYEVVAFMSFVRELVVKADNMRTLVKLKSSENVS